MVFKYQAPDNYKSKSIVLSGQTYEVKNNMVSSSEDIYFALYPMGFTRIVEDEPKKSSTAKAQA